MPRSSSRPDGTLWTEKPVYPHLLFAVDRLDGDRVREYLSRYRNPKLVSFVNGMLS